MVKKLTDTEIQEGVKLIEQETGKDINALTKENVNKTSTIAPQNQNIDTLNTKPINNVPNLKQPIKND